MSSAMIMMILGRSGFALSVRPEQECIQVMDRNNKEKQENDAANLFIMDTIF
jgi:hypothetical protein